MAMPRSGSPVCAATMPSKASAGALSGDGSQHVVADAGGFVETLGLSGRLGAGKRLFRCLAPAMAGVALLRHRSCGPL